MVKFKLAVYTLLLLSLLANGCGQSSTTAPVTVSGVQSIALYSEGINTTPVFVPSARAAAAGTWESGNALYDVFYALREYLHPQDNGKVDRANLYRLLYDVETLLSGATFEVAALPAAKVIVPPFNFGNNFTYEAAFNGATTETCAAITTTDATVKGIVTWIWREAAYPKKREVGVLETAFNSTTKDLTVDFIFAVDYNTDDTVSDYNNRTKISGNSSAHAFEFVQTIAGSSDVSSQIVGKGISRGAGNRFLLKVKNNSDSGFSSARYLVISAEATENTLKNMDPTREAYTDSASLPAEVASYKDYVVTAPFFEFTDLLTDLQNLNKGNTREGTVYLNY